MKNVTSSPLNLFEYLDSGNYFNELLAIQEASDCITGFPELDKFVNLVPGVILLGADSSIGKTTFCVQLALQIAAQEKTVLFFSLEQPRVVISGKLIRNLYAQLFPDSPEPPSNQRSMQEVLYAHKELLSHCMIFDRSDAKSMSDIKEEIETYCDQHPEEHPMVFIDYLQKVKQPTANSVKEGVDANLETLTELSQAYKIAILAISSFNRGAYKEAADFSSFKESGNLEYDADYVLALQLHVVSKESYLKLPENQKRKEYDKAKGEMPRSLDLIILKQRLGPIFHTIPLVYHPEKDLFIQKGDKTNPLKQLISDHTKAEEKDLETYDLGF